MKDKAPYSIKIDDISFNRDWAKEKTEEEFLAEAEINGWYSGVKNRTGKLKEAYKALTARKNAAHEEK